MTACLRRFLMGAFVAGAAVSCSRGPESDAWTVEEIEIPLYHSTTRDPETGNLFHVEYTAAKLVRGEEIIHLVYRPIDFPERKPGFGPGDRVRLAGLESAEDFGAMETADFWITDFKIGRIQ